MFFIHTVAPLLLHATQRQTKTCVSNTLTFLTHACMDAFANKQTNTHFSQICSWCQTRPADPPQQQPPPQIHWSHAGTASAVTNTSTPLSFKIAPSAPTSPSATFCFHSPHTHTHTHTHTQGICPFYCPICPLYKLSVHFKTVISHSAAAYPYSTYFVATILRDVSDSNTMVLFYIQWYLVKKALWW